MTTLHPKDMDNADLIITLVVNLRRDPNMDLSIITDELLRRIRASGAALKLLDKTKISLRKLADDIEKE